MKKYILAAALAVTLTSSAQNSTAYNIIEGSKGLVDLIRIFKIPRTALAAQPALLQRVDSCTLKGVSDFGVQNNTDKPLVVSLFRRNGSGYDAVALSMTILPKSREWLYEIKSGIYKMKLETLVSENEKKTFREGEVKINPCENPVKNIQLTE